MKVCWQSYSHDLSGLEVDRRRAREDAWENPINERVRAG